jgi:hypothetical protein
MVNPKEGIIKHSVSIIVLEDLLFAVILMGAKQSRGMTSKGQEYFVSVDRDNFGSVCARRQSGEL